MPGTQPDTQPGGIGLQSLSIDQMQPVLLHAALDIWRQWCAERPAPTWRDIDLAGFPPPLVPMAAVVDVIDDGDDFRYRFWGSGLTQLFGRDETGSLLSKHGNARSSQIRFQQLRQVVGAFQPLAFQTTFEKSHGLLAEKTNLRLPVADQPGQVTKIISLSLLHRMDMRDYDNLNDHYAQLADD